MKDEKHTNDKGCVCPICGSEVVAANAKPKGRDPRYKAKCSLCDFFYDCRELTPEAALEAASKRWDGWISVEDEMPEYNKYVVVQAIGWNVSTFAKRYSVSGKLVWICHGRILDSVVAWQPLPQLPEVK